jgi:hypothetical protein
VADDVVLLDGSTVASDSEAWRHECEARHLLDGMQLIPRRAYLAAIKARRGDAAYARLADTVTAIWKARREARGVTDD